MNKIRSVVLAGASIAVAVVFFCFFEPAHADGNPPRFEIDPYWPKPLPEGWITGQLGGVCVDSHDHVIVVNRRDITEEEKETSLQAPPIIMFDAAGGVVLSMGDPGAVPNSIHGCFADHENNIWVGGNGDGIIQKYSHDGKLLLQIGKRGVFDSSDGTGKGKALNANPAQFFNPASIAVDSGNGDIYVADGYGNRRVAVFDRSGRFLRQWGRQATKEESENGVGSVFAQVVHCVTISNAGLVYVCDRQGDRVQVFDKMGNFKRNIRIQSKTAHRTNSENAVGTAGSIGFSPDPAQKYMYVANGSDNVIHILDRATGKVLAKFGRPGNQPGDLTDPHSIAVNSKGDIIVGEVPYGGKLQMWRAVKK